MHLSVLVKQWIEVEELRVLRGFVRDFNFPSMLLGNIQALYEIRR